MKTIKSMLLAAVLCCTVSLSAKQYYGSVFGIRSDGTTVNTGSLQKAIDYISAESPGDTLTIWVGRYLTGSVQLKSNVTIMLNEGAVIVGVPSAYDYEKVNGYSALFLAEGQENISITGKGVIEGNSKKVTELIKKQETKGFIPSAGAAYPSLVAMDRCKNISVKGIILQDYCANAQVYTNCNGIAIDSVTVFGTAVDGNIGIVLTDNQDIHLSNCYFDTRGDAVKAKNNTRFEIVRSTTPNGTEIKP